STVSADQNRQTRIASRTQRSRPSRRRNRKPRSTTRLLWDRAPGRDIMSRARNAETISATPASLGRRLGLGHSPRDLSAQSGSYGSVAAEAEPMGNDAPHHSGPPLRQEAQRDPRLLRGWSEPGHNGDERLERRRARVVAQPAGAPQRYRRAHRWHARHPWAGSAGRGARAPLGPMARDGGRRRWLRDSPPVRDRGHRPRTAFRFRVTR